MSRTYPRRGNVYWTQLEAAVGAAMQKTRPCLVVTKDIINEHRHTVVIVPLSNTSPKRPPLYVSLPSIGPTSQAVIDQIRAVDKGSIGKRVSTITVAEMAQVEDALRTALDME